VDPVYGLRGNWSPSSLRRRSGRSCFSRWLRPVGIQPQPVCKQPSPKPQQRCQRCFLVIRHFRLTLGDERARVLDLGRTGWTRCTVCASKPRLRPTQVLFLPLAQTSGNPTPACLQTTLPKTATADFRLTLGDERARVLDLGRTGWTRCTVCAGTGLRVAPRNRGSDLRRSCFSRWLRPVGIQPQPVCKQPSPGRLRHLGRN
jgi:hypothetical protein